MSLKSLFVAATAMAAFSMIGSANAGAISFTPDTFANISSNAAVVSTFDIAPSMDPASAKIWIDVGTVDEGFLLDINGATVFDILAFDINDPGHPIGVLPGLDRPWVASATGPRVKAMVSSTGVSLQGLIQSTDLTYTDLNISLISLPTFNTGSNTLTIQSRNEFGPGGMTNVSLSGAIPEPGMLTILGIGLAGLGAAKRRRKAA